MNKKRELVKQVMSMLESAHVEQDTYESIPAVTAFWIDHPTGHYNDGNASLEGALSCLMEENLAAILALGVPEDGMKYSALWKEWGRQGCLKSAPTVMNFEAIPILRVRHDSYLSWFRGYRFQNSYDAYGNGSNGESDNDLAETAEFCRDFMHPDYRELRGHMTDEELNMCCTALIMAYPIHACRGKRSFYKVLQQYPEVFDRFLRESERYVRSGVKRFTPTVTLREKAVVPIGVPVLQEYAVVDSERQVATLRLGETEVNLTWCSVNGLQSYTLKFPAWSDELCQKRKYHHMKMWWLLSITLFALAGFSAAEYRIQPLDGGQIESVEPKLYPEDRRVTCLRDLYKLMSANYQ